MTSKLILLRHGESTWNKKGLFTGWTDVDLSARGIREARQAGRILKKSGLVIDQCYTSVLTRAVHTLWLALESLGEIYLPITNAWELNERHYGGLQGLNKKQMMRQVGTEQVHIWRRSYDIRPPKISKDLYSSIAEDNRYKSLKKSQIPWSESLKDTCERAWPYFQKEIEPGLKKGQTILISAHGNSLRGLIKHLENISDEAIPSLEIPYARPIVYEFEKDKQKLILKKRYYLDEAGKAKDIKKLKLITN